MSRETKELIVGLDIGTSKIVAVVAEVAADGRLKPLFPDAMTQNRQELPAAYVPNGALYLFRWSDFVAGRRIPTAGSSAFVMSAEESVDIDTQADFDRAQSLLEGGSKSRGDASVD